MKILSEQEAIRVEPWLMAQKWAHPDMGKGFPSHAKQGQGENQLGCLEMEREQV